MCNISDNEQFWTNTVFYYLPPSIHAALTKLMFEKSNRAIANIRKFLTLAEENTAFSNGAMADVVINSRQNELLFRSH